MIRISFLSFQPDAIPPSGKDYLIDVEVEGAGVYARGRNGHSRFIEPRYPFDYSE